MSQGVIQRGFAAGELAPVLHARADQVRYTQGLRTCRNFMVRREGGITTRPGLPFVSAAKSNTAGTRFMRYIGSSGSNVLIEMGAGYFRFFLNGAAVSVSGVPAYSAITAYVPGDLVLQAGTNYYCHAATTGNAPPNAAFWYALTGSVYEIPTPYGLSTLPDWAQSGNVITLTHPSVAPRELTFESSTRWVLSTIVTTPSIAAPTGLVMTPGPLGPGPLVYSYVVTALKAETYEESQASAAATDSAGGLVGPTPSLPHELAWTAVTGAVEYLVYCDPYQNGVYGFIGTAQSNSFNDTGFVPDFNVTPPIAVSLFAATNDYPSHSARFQQRRVFANSNTEPDSIWFSRTGFPSNFGITSPLLDDDAVTVRLAGNNQHAVEHLVALKAGLVTLTDGGEWTITGGGGPQTPLTPSSINADQETYVGVSDVRPVVVGNAILYLQARGSIIRELRFDQAVEGLAGRDLTIFATHLFERKTIVAMDLQQVPHSIVWCVRNDGTLLGLTYIPDQEVWGWHRHDTDGTFEDVCVVPEADEDVVYVLVARTVGGSTVRYIERLARREARDGYFAADSKFLDSMLSYSGVSTTAVSGLSHLEGLTVYALVNGVKQGPFTVSGGAITLTSAGTNIHVGLAYTPEIELLDFDVQGSDVRDKRKRVQSVTVLIERSSRGFQAGPSAAKMRVFTPQAWQGTDQSSTGAAPLNLTGGFDDYGRMIIQQPDPLPLTILGVIPHMEIGG